MTPDEFKRLLAKQRDALTHAIVRTIPVKAATVAVHHFRDNFRASGFVDDSLKQWTRSKRQDDPKHPDRSYKTLLSRRNYLYKSISKRIEPAKAIVYTDVPYAAAHNEGTTNAGRSHNVRIPKRQFMGKSKQLDKKCLKLIDEELKKILNSH